ncbi:MAG: hypothetical protein IE926_12810, partial [Micrococcales bacterium]|nr:hypothetical protein [Micrococcales bacterium]
PATRVPIPAPPAASVLVGSAGAVPTTGSDPTDPPTLAAEPTSTEAAGGAGMGTLVAGGVLVVLVGGAAVWVARRRRS